MAKDFKEWPIENDGKPWSDNEFKLVFNLYLKMPFGHMSQTNKKVRELAKMMHRKPGSVAIRLVNFASCDPMLQARGIVGMNAAIKQCQPYWDAYNKDREAFVFETELVLSALLKEDIEKSHANSLREIDGIQGKEREALVKVRVNQDIFRQMVLSNYNNSCAVTGISEPQLLVASHIIPWADDPEKRLDPTNAICLSALYDKAFDRGLISFDKDYRLLLSSQIKQYNEEPFYAKHFGSVEHQRLIFPEKCYKPNLVYLEYHRDCIFEK